MILQILSYVGIAVGLVLLTLAIALGLYYLSELVEEHSEPTKRFLQRMIFANIGLLLSLYMFDGFPLKLVLMSLFSYYIYYQNLKRFPYVHFTDAAFLISCGLVLINHYFWFAHFSNPHIPSLQERLADGYKEQPLPTFSEVAAFFGICIWFVPFTLFVSLSAGENILPTIGSDGRVASDGNQFRKIGLAKHFVIQAREKLLACTRMMGWELDRNRNSIPIY
ncbi:hypothetical protein BABINDRAFT_160596 [Babjeviella inositovora NRRL Y-12698]|uniref:Protein SVP26 n=1 Tax=Babjeviella inositovora NRRL Y-12698 TaxID=984486 RepID=A0A1E3QW50_9ASCO|nr:uncharacterized protein BABINDRAFT_160596 [Babjeviella inositovora NRRL Y-12698]ODQ81207.1 hypothetical protein BABINDRAFT_160596 [Babjeviella inositovora NRRL Y-12698]